MPAEVRRSGLRGYRSDMTGAAPQYLRVARTPRMIGLLVLLLAIAAVCGRLGMWQLDRAQQRAAQSADHERVAAVDLSDVLAPQQALSGDLVGTTVVVDGTFGADQVLVAGRELDGRTGHLVVTPLVLADGAVLAVVRGWVAEPADAAAFPAPAGVVQVRGRLAAGEAARGTGGEVTAVSPAELVNRWGGPIYSAYLVLEQVEPAQGDLTLLPEPAAGPGLDLQNLAYALQWWIFGGLAVLLWLRMVRDEARSAVGPEVAGSVP